MIKLIFLAVLCIALYEPVQSTITEEKTDCGYKLHIVIDPNKKCKDNCLGSKNSKKVSHAVLAVIHANGHSKQVLDDLRLIPFIYGQITYNKWADYIKSTELSYEGFEELQKVVRRYKVCKNVCKVFHQLRTSLKNRAAEDADYVEGVSETGERVVRGVAELFILSDNTAALRELLKENPDISEIQFECNTFIADDSLKSPEFKGLIWSVKADDFVLTKNLIWDFGKKVEDGNHPGKDHGKLSSLSSTLFNGLSLRSCWSMLRLCQERSRYLRVLIRCSSRIDYCIKNSSEKTSIRNLQCREHNEINKYSFLPIRILKHATICCSSFFCVSNDDTMLIACDPVCSKPSSFELNKATCANSCHRAAVVQTVEAIFEAIVDERRQ